MDTNFVRQLTKSSCVLKRTSTTEAETTRSGQWSFNEPGVPLQSCWAWNRWRHIFMGPKQAFKVSSRDGDCIFFGWALRVWLLWLVPSSHFCPKVWTEQSMMMTSQPASQPELVQVDLMDPKI